MHHCGRQRSLHVPSMPVPSCMQAHGGLGGATATAPLHVAALSQRLALLRAEERRLVVRTRVQPSPGAHCKWICAFPATVMQGPCHASTRADHTTPHA